MRYRGRNTPSPMTIEYLCPNEECEKSIEVTFTPDRPAPPCSDHDSPAFSDPGDPGELDFPEQCPHCSLPLIEEKVYDFCTDAYQDAVNDAMERYAESKYDRDR